MLSAGDQGACGRQGGLVAPQEVGSPGKRAAGGKGMGQAECLLVVTSPQFVKGWGS